MPRRYAKKAYAYKRPGYRSCAKMVAGDAQKALAMVKSVKRLINVEIKNFDVQLTSQDIDIVPVITQLSNIPQGDTTSTRDGAQCKMVGLELSFRIVQAAAASITSCRIMLVLDKQTNQAIYVANDLLADVTISDGIISPRNLDNSRRFTVLYDRTFTMQDGGVRSFVVKKYFKKDVLLRYDGSTPSIADLTQNSMSLLTTSSEGTNVPTFTLFSRLRYVDN